jgi:hypothetical protein
MPVLDDFQCRECGFIDEFFRDVNNPDEEKDCPQPDCGGKMHRLIPIPTINDSNSATHICPPSDYKHMIRAAKASERWKGIKDPKRRKELQEVASDLNRHKN